LRQAADSIFNILCLPLLNKLLIWLLLKAEDLRSPFMHDSLKRTFNIHISPSYDKIFSGAGLAET